MVPTDNDIFNVAFTKGQEISLEILVFSILQKKKPVNIFLSSALAPKKLSNPKK